jgi:hypothetical protein
MISGKTEEAKKSPLRSAGAKPAQGSKEKGPASQLLQGKMSLKAARRSVLAHWLLRVLFWGIFAGGTTC